MEKSTRVQNSVRNLKVNIFCQIAALFANFIVRTIFIRTLSEDYFGINGLFTNIISILSLAEMGIGNAIVFSLYLPLAKGDTAKVRALMNFYKRVYEFLGFFIAAAGLALIPFLSFFMKEQPEIEHLILVYCLFLFDATLSYFYAYKRAIIIADQKMYICSIYQNGMYIVRFLAQALCLLLTRNFILYLLVQIATSFLANFTITKKAEKLYPFLKERSKDRLEKEDRKQIGGNVRALFLHRIGDVIVNNTDNVLISALVGVSSVGFYSNYILISNAVTLLVNQIFDAFTASLGNLNSLEDREAVYRVYQPLYFLSFLVCGFCATALYYLLNPFISCWVGSGYMLPQKTVLVICLNFYLLQMRKVNLIFKEALGLFREDRYRALAEALLNLVISIILGRWFGMIGILAGTTISILSTSFWLEPWVLYRYGFDKPVRAYFKAYAVRSIAVLLIFCTTGLAVSLIPFTGIPGLLASAFFCVLIPCGLFCLIYFRNPQFRLILDQAKKYLSHTSIS